MAAGAGGPADELARGIALLERRDVREAQILAVRIPDHFQALAGVQGAPLGAELVRVAAVDGDGALGGEDLPPVVAVVIAAAVQVAEGGRLRERRRLEVEVLEA